MTEKYEEYKSGYRVEIQKFEKQSGVLGYVKLGLLIVTAIALWRFFRYGMDAVAVMIVCLLAIVNVVFWIGHYRVCDKIKYRQGIIRVIDRYLSRMDGSWVAFADDGAEYTDYNHAYTFDLDIFGPKSIFQFLNATNTYHGRQQFQKDLSQPAYNAAEMKKRQAAIQELSGLDCFSHNFQHFGSFIKDRKSIPALIERLEQKETFLKGKWIRFVLQNMPLVFTPVALAILIFRVTPLYAVGAALLGVQTVIWVLLTVKTSQYLSFIGNVKYGLEKYSVLYTLLEKQTFESERLKELQSHVTLSGHSAAAAIKQLDKIVQRVEVRSNIIVYLVFNVLLLWDIECAFALEKWKNDYVPHFEEWFSSLGEFESLLSFSVINNVVSGMCYPGEATKLKFFEAKGVGHPLIPNSKRVYNDFVLDDDIVMISGSNMSGKTTFLRTIGLNLVLAKCGCSVCAAYMSFSDTQIITSMRISDDLNEGISTFYAELKKIKAIISLAESNQNVIFFIDEIFRGTNSSDRIAGAKAVISKLYNLKAFGFLTTHDLTLCESSNDVQIANWHFSERYTDGELTFDYKVAKGIAETTNGQYLMRMIGILE